MAEGTYIKDLKQIDDASDSCDLIIEDETPTTMRIKLGDLKSYITQEVSTQVTNALSRISTNETAIATINNDLSKYWRFSKFTTIPSNADLNDYTDYGNYCIVSNDNANTISNMPISNAGSLRVMDAIGNNNYIHQIYISLSCNIYIRYADNGSTVRWYSWNHI